MRVLVCGGRNWQDAEHLEKTLDRLLAAPGPFEWLIHVDARGVDRMAGNGHEAAAFSSEISFRSGTGLTPMTE